MRLQVLISTMNQKNFQLIEKMNIQTEAVVVNQCDHKSIEEYIFKGKKILWINTTERGLSRSRNMAVRYSDADICAIADDDLRFCDGYENVIIEQFVQHKKYDIICFKVNEQEERKKRYPSKSCDINYFTSFRVSSDDITFRRDKIYKNINFDVNIGAGTDYPMGEENVFLFECLRKGYKIRFKPYVISEVLRNESTWFNGFDEKYFIGRGAAFAALKTRYEGIIRLQFAIRKYRRYKEQIDLFSALRAMKVGSERYHKLVE